jgi:hypothetical protein
MSTATAARTYHTIKRNNSHKPCACYPRTCSACEHRHSSNNQHSNTCNNGHIEYHKGNERTGSAFQSTVITETKKHTTNVTTTNNTVINGAPAAPANEHRHCRAHILLAFLWQRCGEVVHDVSAADAA